MKGRMARGTSARMARRVHRLGWCPGCIARIASVSAPASRPGTCCRRYPNSPIQPNERFAASNCPSSELLADRRFHHLEISPLTAAIAHPRRHPPRSRRRPCDGATSSKHSIVASSAPATSSTSRAAARRSTSPTPRNETREYVHAADAIARSRLCSCGPPSDEFGVRVGSSARSPSANVATASRGARRRASSPPSTRILRSVDRVRHVERKSRADDAERYPKGSFQREEVFRASRSPHRRSVGATPHADNIAASNGRRASAGSASVARPSHNRPRGCGEARSPGDHVREGHRFVFAVQQRVAAREVEEKRGDDARGSGVESWKRGVVARVGAPGCSSSRLRGCSSSSSSVSGAPRSAPISAPARARNARIQYRSSRASGYCERVRRASNPRARRLDPPS